MRIAIKDPSTQSSTSIRKPAQDNILLGKRFFWDSVLHIWADSKKGLSSLIHELNRWCKVLMPHQALTMRLRTTLKNYPILGSDASSFMKNLKNNSSGKRTKLWAKHCHTSPVSHCFPVTRLKRRKSERSDRPLMPEVTEGCLGKVIPQGCLGV